MKISNTHTRGVLIALAGTTAWATTGIFISVLLNRYQLAPLALAFWRDLFIAVVALAGLRVLRPAALRIARKDLPFFFAYGFVGLATFNAMWTYSVKFNGAAVATVLAYSSPAFTVLLARVVLGEALTVRKLVAALVCLLGCAFVARADSIAAWQVNPAGILVGLGTGLAFACYSLAGRWSARRFASSWTVTAYGFLFAAGGLALVQRPATLFSMGTEWRGWALLLFLALGPSLVGFALFTRSLRDLPASTAGLIAALEPVLAALMAVVFLGEQLVQMQWLGAALILGAVVLVQLEAQPSVPTAVQEPAG
jgi:drug/metabolite transporter (DMT)-like permease